MTGEIINLEQLPDLVLEHMLKCLSFEEIAKFRRISRRFNIICKSLLNKGFRNVEKHHIKCLKVSIRFFLYSTIHLILLIANINTLGLRTFLTAQLYFWS